MLGFEAGRGLRYRQRIRLQVEGDRLGLFGAGSHRFVEVERCQVVTDELWRAVERLRHLLRGRGVTREVETVEVRLLPGGDCPSVDLVLSPGAATARVVSQWVELLASDFLVRARGSETLTLERYQLLPDTYLLAPVGGFVQVNHEMNTLLVQAVLSLAARRSLKSALDVFCGCGNFALPLARAGLEVTGVEAHGPAISAARLAAHEQGLVLQLHAQDAAAFLAEAVARGERHDLVVVDPPRAGAKGLTGYLGQICGQTLVMVSCDPATLARDVKELTSRGFRVASTTGFDMFPQTHHAETLCVLERVPSSS